MKKLRESWAGVTTAIEELEREGRVLVTRTGKTEQSQEREGQMKMVFLDDIGKEKDPLDQGQFAAFAWLFLLGARPLQRVPTPASPLTFVFLFAEFRDLWRSLKTPVGDELAQELKNGAFQPSIAAFSRCFAAYERCWLDRSADTLYTLQPVSPHPLPRLLRPQRPRRRPKVARVPARRTGGSRSPTCISRTRASTCPKTTSRRTVDSAPPAFPPPERGHSVLPFVPMLFVRCSSAL